MPTPFPIARTSQVTADTALTAATEAVIATISGLSVSDPTQTITLSGRCTILTAAGGTNVTLRWRRTALTGAVVGEADPTNIGAALSAEITHAVDDQPGDVASMVYVLTATMAGGNATATDAWIMAIIHS